MRTRGRGRGNRLGEDRWLPGGLPLLLAVRPVRLPRAPAWLDIPSLVEAAKQTAATGATEFCIVAAVRGPDERLMTQMRGVAAIKDAVDINVAASLESSLPNKSTSWSRWVSIGTTTIWRRPAHSSRTWSPPTPGMSAWKPWRWCATPAWRVCCGGIVGLGETVAQRAEFAALPPPCFRTRCPLNFLNRAPAPFGDLPVMSTPDALRTIGAFRLALPRTILHYAGGREITLGELGTKEGCSASMRLSSATT